MRGAKARRRGLEGGLIGLAIVVAVALVNALTFNTAVPIVLLILGPLVACTRAGRREVIAVSAAALLAVVVVEAVDHRFGTGADFRRLLIVGVGSAMAIWIADIRESREHAAELLASQAAVARLLMSADTLAAATLKLLATIGEQLDWELGALWTVRPRSSTIVCVEVWASSSIDAADFLAATRAAEFAPGEGLPGRVWKSGEPEWVADILDQRNFPRAEEARAAGLHGALAFPIRSSSGILGVVEFFATRPREPDRPMLDLIDALGAQLGDYVERKLAEEAVGDSEARKTAVLQSALDCVVTMDGNGLIVEFNPAAERTFGYTAAEAVGQELAELIIPPDLRERHRAGLKRYLTGGGSRMLDRRVELRAIRKDGRELPVELAITSIAVEPPMFSGYLRDLSERREAEALQHRLAAIVESSDDAILSKDRDLVIRSWNLGAQRLYGYTPEEAIGQHITILIPDDRAGEEVELLARVLRDERVEHFETRRRRKDGTIVDVSLTVSPLREPGGQIVGASVIGRDISERKRIEAQRAELLRMEQETRLQTERAERRASFLAEAQSVLSSSLDFAVTLRNLAELAVPQLADWCSIDTVRADGTLERLALVHVDPAKQRLAREIESKYPNIPDPERGALKAVLTGESQLIREIPPEMITEAAQSDEHARMMRQLGLRSAMVVPLLGHDRALGAITFVVRRVEPASSTTTTSLWRRTWRRARPMAIDNARLYSERDYIATHAPAEPACRTGCPTFRASTSAARYRAAGEGNEVGGDFYDIFRSGESTWGIAIGDVRGKGPERRGGHRRWRATRCARRRCSEQPPSRVLGTLNEAMVLQPADDRFCTVAYARLEPGDDGSIRMTLGVRRAPAAAPPARRRVRRDGRDVRAR